MHLPDLPRQNKKKEADFGVQFRAIIKQFPFIKTGAFELKHTRGKNYLNFNEVKPEQIAYGYKIQSEEGVIIRVIGFNGEPDYIYLKNEPYFITIKYPKSYFIISLDDWIKEREISNRKSLTEERAISIGKRFDLGIIV